MKFQFNDGGRVSAGYKGSAGDCVVRSVAIATGLPYQHVYDLVNKLSTRERMGRRKRGTSNARTGVHKSTIKWAMESLGWQAGRAQLEFIPARHSALHKRRVRALIPQSVRFPTRQGTLFANDQRALGRSQSSSWIPPFVPRRRVSRPSHPRCARSWSRGSVDGNPIGPMVWTCLRWSLVRAAGRGSTIHCQCFR